MIVNDLCVFLFWEIAISQPALGFQYYISNDQLTTNDDDRPSDISTVLANNLKNTWKMKSTQTNGSTLISILDHLLQIYETILKVNNDSNINSDGVQITYSRVNLRITSDVNHKSKKILDNERKVEKNDSIREDNALKNQDKDVTSEINTNAEVNQKANNSTQKWRNDFDEGVLEQHNLYRSKHSVPALKLNKNISKVSQEWAEYLASKKEFEHRPNGNYGENLYSIWSSDAKFEIKSNMAVDAWYSEIQAYNFTEKTDIHETGHFTQLVWKGSKELGVGLAKGTIDNRYVIVCNYHPPGNYIGQFTQNVNRPVS